MNLRYVFEDEPTELASSNLDVRARIKTDSQVSGLSSWWCRCCSRRWRRSRGAFETTCLWLWPVEGGFVEGVRVPSACKVTGLRLKREIGRWLIKSGVRFHLGIVSNNSKVMMVNTKCIVLALFWVLYMQSSNSRMKLITAVSPSYRRAGCSAVLNHVANRARNYLLNWS